MKLFHLAAALLMLGGCRTTPAPSETPGATKAPDIPEAARPPAADVAVTRANFGSLEFNLSGSRSGMSTQLRLEPGAAIYRSRQQGKRRVPFSRAELDALIGVLNAAKFPSLAGDYTQPGLREGINESVSLTLRGKRSDGKPLIFTLNNYGEIAPRAYGSVRRHLYALAKSKFPEKMAGKKPS